VPPLPATHAQLRIVLNGGRVARMKHPATGAGVGPQRVWFASIDYPGLAMSRAFGDAPARRIGVTVEPQLYVHQLDKEDELLIAATDGVWDVLSNEDAVALAGNARSATEGAAQVVEAAKAAWHASERGTYVDDITAVVARVMHSSNPRL
jgi:serine/threonine protein phosphatase PrpC